MTMDYASLRKLTDASATVNRVEVNQRALIDKILARYATASAVYRELLQNSNDANATVSEIDFTIKDGIVESVTYRNNGFPFREQDWDRLRKIAEGNPDASKVGAFGYVRECDRLLILTVVLQSWSVLGRCGSPVRF